MKKIAVIMCAGKSTRWNNYLGVEKQFIEIEGETLLERTIRLLKKNGINDVYLTGDRSLNKFGPVVRPEQPTGIELDKFYNCLPVWNEPDELIFVYGDVFFTDEAMQKICSVSKEFLGFGRFGPSKITGKPWGELFAVKSQNKRYVVESLNKIHEEYKMGKIKLAGGWEFYRQLDNLQLLEHKVTKEHFIEIDDFTDDFDFPNDYDVWIKKRGVATRLS